MSAVMDTSDNGTSRLSLYPDPIPQLRVNRTDLSSAGTVEIEPKPTFVASHCEVCTGWRVAIGQISPLV